MSRLHLAMAIALIVVSFWLGWEWRDRSADLTVSREETKQASAVVAQVQGARAVEHDQADTMAAIGAKHEEDRAAAETVPDAVVADLRADRLRLRDGWAGCETQRLSEAVAGASKRDAAAQRREEFAGAVVRAGRDADDQLRACQAVVAADRAEVNQ